VGYSRKSLENWLDIYKDLREVILLYKGVMGTRDGAWTGIRYRGSGFLFWVRLAIEIVRIDRNRTDHIGSHFLVK
jgi:hypothetical protein